MAVSASDMKFFLSGGAANTDPNASIGDEVSATEVDFGTIAENLFDNVTAGEALAGHVDYRCIYLFNTNGSDTLEDVKIWIETNTPSASTSIKIGLDPAGIGDGSATGVADTPVDDETAPAGVSFSAPANEGAALAIGDLEAGEGIAVWIERTVDADAPAAASDGFTLRIAGLPV